METSPSTWFEAVWPRVAAYSGIGYVATAYAVSRWLTRRCPAVIETPTQLGVASVESLTCFTPDGVLLKGWCIEPARPCATVALFHGMRNNRAEMLSRIAFLTDSGYRCVAFDHRAHGESGGRVCSFGYHERHDVEAIAAHIASRWPSEPRAAVATSMGAAAICFAGPAAHAFDALVLESVYHDLHGAFHNRVGRGYPSWFGHFRSGILWITERRLGLRVDDVAPVAHIARLAPRPVLLLTGTDDPHAPPNEVEALARQLPETAQFHAIPGADHHNVCAIGGAAYRDLLLAFLDRHLFQRRLAIAA